VVTERTQATPDGTAMLGDKRVRRIGYGAMQLAGPGVFGPPRDRDEALAVLRRAVALGVDHIDTSQYYGPDVVNELIRAALHPYPARLRLVTKVGARRDAHGAWLAAQRPEELRTGVEDNLRTLGAERMDLVNLREDEGDDGDVPPLAERIGVLEDMRHEGKLDLIGTSNVTRAQAEAALELVAIASVQNPYSILDRSSEDVLDLCRERDVAFVPFFPLGSAFTGGPARLAADPAIARIAGKHSATPSQIALAWLLRRDSRILLVPGTSSVAASVARPAHAAPACASRTIQRLPSASCSSLSAGMMSQQARYTSTPRPPASAPTTTPPAASRAERRGHARDRHRPPRPGDRPRRASPGPADVDDRARSSCRRFSALRARRARRDDPERPPG
jgi:aryl-alcohol dehydrogenase-like predicted oxidoreductase